MTEAEWNSCTDHEADRRITTQHSAPAGAVLTLEQPSIALLFCWSNWFYTTPCSSRKAPSGLASLLVMSGVPSRFRS
jgi:hypothetical protein